jgi:hypothetical protein
MAHKIAINLPPAYRHKLEVVRLYLSHALPDGEFCPFNMAVMYLLDNAPIQEMLKQVSGAHSNEVKDGIENGTDHSGSVASEVAPSAAELASPPKRGPGRPRKGTPVGAAAE